MKYGLLILMVLCSISIYAQNTIVNDSVIYLNEIIIQQKKPNCQKFKTKGKNNASFSVAKKSEFVTFLENIPNGKVNSLKLYFNNRKNILYNENSFRLKIYSVKDDLPYESLINYEVRFKVSDKKESVILDLYDLNLINHEKLFVGLELLEENDDMSFSIDCRTDKKSSNTYYKLHETNEWLRIPNINLSIDLELNCR